MAPETLWECFSALIAVKLSVASQAAFPSTPGEKNYSFAPGFKLKMALSSIQPCARNPVILCLSKSLASVKATHLVSNFSFKIQGLRLDLKCSQNLVDILLHNGINWGQIINIYAILRQIRSWHSGMSQSLLKMAILPLSLLKLWFCQSSSNPAPSIHPYSSPLPPRSNV